IGLVALSIDLVHQAFPGLLIQALQLSDVLLILLLGRQGNRYDVARAQTSNVKLDTASDKGFVVRARTVASRENDDLVAKVGHVAETRAALVVWPEVLPVGVEDNGADRDLTTVPLRHGRLTLVEVAK